MPLHETTTSSAKPIIPSHIILFGSLLGRMDSMGNGSEKVVRDALHELGYEEVWHRWNGFDWAQDEVDRRGGVRIWRISQSNSTLDQRGPP